MTQAKKPQWLPLKADQSKRDPAHWTSTPSKTGGLTRQHLSPAGLREVGRRVQAGEGPRQIAREMGMAERNAGIISRRILAALQQPTGSEQWELFREEVLRRFEAGQDRETIARATGKSVDRVSTVLREAGHRQKPRGLRLTQDEAADVARRLRAGEGPGLIARDLGCNPTAIWRRAKKMRAAGEILPEAPDQLCECRKPLGHRGICRLPGTVVDQIGQLLRDGLPNAEIARRVGYPLGRVTDYARPVIAQLKNEGVRCVCGQDLGHRGSCPHFSAEIVQLKADIARLLGEGKWKAEIGRILGREPSVIGMYANPILQAWEAEGRQCPCGKLINHTGRCSYRMEGRELTKVKLRKVRVDLPRSTMMKVVYRLKKGRPAAAIADDLEIRLTSVAAITKAFVAGGGQLPDQCRCGAPRAHANPCLRGRKPRPTSARPSVAARLSEEQRRKLRVYYRTGVTYIDAAARTELSVSTVQRHFRDLAKTSRAQVKPCTCGLPARHTGWCSARSFKLLSPRWTARIQAMLWEGQTIRQVAEALNIEFNTVVRHAGDVRVQRFNQGLACACGREIGHPGACSATWERHFGERGTAPLFPALIAKLSRPLLKGIPLPKIAADAAVSQNSVRRALRLLSIEDRRIRAAAIRQRDDSADASLAPEAMMAEVQRAVPKRLEPSIRDEVIADLYLAVVEGRLEPADLKDAARVLINRSFSTWANVYGPASLDESLGDDSTATRGDMIADTTALAGIDDITIGDDA